MAEINEQPKYPSALETAKKNLADAHASLNHGIAYICQNNLPFMSKLIDLLKLMLPPRLSMTGGHSGGNYGRVQSLRV